MSKGSKQRPRQVSSETYESNWDNVFGKKQKEEKKEEKPQLEAEVKPFDTLDEK